MGSSVIGGSPITIQIAAVCFTGDNTDLGIAGAVSGGVGMYGGSAFTSYERSLRAFMGLCVDGGGRVGDCR